MSKHTSMRIITESMIQKVLLLIPQNCSLQQNANLSVLYRLQHYSAIFWKAVEVFSKGSAEAQEWRNWAFVPTFFGPHTSRTIAPEDQSHYITLKRCSCDCCSSTSFLHLSNHTFTSTWIHCLKPWSIFFFFFVGGSNNQTDNNILHVSFQSAVRL